MAFPFLALALGAAGLGTVGSTVSNVIAQRRIDRERANAVELENIRQRRLQAQADAAQLESEEPFTEAEERQQKETSNLLAALRNVEAPLAPSSPSIAPRAPGIVAGTQAAESGRARAFTRGQAEALADLRGFGQMLFEANRQRLRPAERIAQTARSMQRSADILPLELEAANRAGDTARSIADIFGVVRDLGMAAAPFVAGGGAPAIVGGGESLGGQGGFSVANNPFLPLSQTGRPVPRLPFGVPRGGGTTPFIPVPRI